MEVLPAIFSIFLNLSLIKELPDGARKRAAWPWLCGREGSAAVIAL